MTSEVSETGILGQDITALALGQSRDSVVLSVQMPVAEFAHLEKLCETSGKSLSEIVRAAVAAYRAEPVAR